MKESKKYLLRNVITNFLVIIVQGVINLWMTPYLIKHLGLGVYGMIPLVISFIAYFNIITSSITNSVSRYVIIYVNNNNIAKGNVYFSSAIVVLVVISVFLLGPAVIVSLLFSDIFHVPAGYERQTAYLFMMIMTASVIMIMKAPFRISVFLKHRFDLFNAFEILSKILRLVILVLCFTYLKPSLEYFGVSYLAMTLFALSAAVLLTKRLTPKLKFKFNLFSWSAIREMSHMSFWLTLNQVGAILYLSCAFIIINIFLGPEEVGRFGPLALLVTLLATFTNAICSIFFPIAMEYIAKERLDLLAIQTRRAVKFIGIVMAFPVGILCGLSSPILTWWLGPDFSELSPLVWLLIMPWIVTISVRPMFGIFSGMNKVKIPALVTIAIGIINIVFSILLIINTNLGIYSVAVSLLFCWTGKNLFFTPVYTAVVTEQSKSFYVKSFLPGILVTIVVSLLLLMLDQLFYMVSFIRLLTASVSVSLLISALCYKLILNKQDRDFLWSLFFLRLRR